MECIVWLWCCLFQNSTTSKNIDKILAICTYLNSHLSYQSRRHKSKDSSSVVGWNQAVIACTMSILSIHSNFEKNICIMYIAPVAGRLIKMRWALLKSKIHSGKIINKNKMAWNWQKKFIWYIAAFTQPNWAAERSAYAMRTSYWLLSISCRI